MLISSISGPACKPLTLSAWMVRTQLFLAHSRWVVSKAFNEQSQLKKIEDCSILTKHETLRSRIQREARPSRKLDEMKRALAGWAQTQLPHVRAMCGSLVSLSFDCQLVYSAIQERDPRQPPCSVQPTRGIADASTFSPASFGVGTCFSKLMSRIRSERQSLHSRGLQSRRISVYRLPRHRRKA